VSVDTLAARGGGVLVGGSFSKTLG